MGWAGGSIIAEEVWLVVSKHIPKGSQRALVAREIIDIFENADCDTINEAKTLCQDALRRTEWNGDDNLYEPLEPLLDD